VHKGYTIKYFIDFFKKIPDNRWTTGHIVSKNGKKCSALGHAYAGNSDLKMALLSRRFDYEALVQLAPKRAIALVQIFRDSLLVAAINDGKGRFKRFGKTPKARIIRALRMRKRLGKAP
jgi:hypothetical protein